MNLQQRRALRERFDFKCGYCGVGETDIGAEMTVDHFRPSSKGGADDPGN
ncbi:MAG: HNH endonuclease [Planctomycetota bacterium]|nr:HNH endonuclease [Planctomycetota bacterium]